MIFRKTYFILTLFLLSIELFIAIFVNDSFVRPYVGDFLVVIMLYCVVRTFLRCSAKQAAIGVFIFACAVELSQYFQLITRLGLTHSSSARAILGQSFDWTDIIAYFLGVSTCILTENYLCKYADSRG
jgi:hypothetical protein